MGMVISNASDLWTVRTSSIIPKSAIFWQRLLFFLIRSKQIACARCNRVSLDERFGAFGFESDHVDENFRKKGEKKEKDFEAVCSKCCNILKLLAEVANTQVRRVFAMLFV